MFFRIFKYSMGEAKFEKGVVRVSSKMRNTKNNKMQDGKFKKKNIKHDPQAESARAVFGEPKAKEYDPTDFKI